VFGVWVRYDLPAEYEGTIRNNIIAQNALDGIRIAADGFDWYPTSTHPYPGSGTISTQIVNNNVTGNAGAGILRDLDVGGVGAPTIRNSILYDNNDDLVSAAATYSDVSDADPGTGNLSVDPGFLHAPDFVDFSVDYGDEDSLVVADSGVYQVGDVIEINADDVAREVTSIPGPADVAFSPAMDYPTSPGTAVADWGASSDVIDDYRLDPGSDLSDAGDPDPAYNDAQPPGQGGPRNDMGAYGGPDAGDVGPPEP